MQSVHKHSSSPKCRGMSSLESLPARKSVSETVFALRKLPPPQRDDTTRPFPIPPIVAFFRDRSTRSLSFTDSSVADFDFDLLFCPSAKNVGRRRLLRCFDRSDRHPRHHFSRNSDCVCVNQGLRRSDRDRVFMFNKSGNYFACSVRALEMATPVCFTDINLCYFRGKQQNKRGPKVRFLFEKPPPTERGGLLRRAYLYFRFSSFARPARRQMKVVGRVRREGGRKRKERRFQSRLVNLHVNAREGVRSMYVYVAVEVGGFIDAPKSPFKGQNERQTLK